MKKRYIVAAALLTLAAAGCRKTEVAEEQKEAKGYAGVYHGVSWKGASKGVSLDETDQKIETTLKLSEDGIIEDVEMNFLVLKDGKWRARNNPESRVSIDYSVDPTPAVPGETYEAGRSMFDIETNDKMGLYVVGVDGDGTVALGIVDAVIRYKLEMKLEPGYDFDRTLEEVTIGGSLVPTVRTSGSGLLKPGSWEDLDGADLFAIHPWNHVMSDYGVLKGIDETSTMREVLEALGVEFEGDTPKAMDASYGFHSTGGWKGNYDAIAEYLVGKSAKEVTSLVDWTLPKYANNINEERFFGVDRIAGATRTAQNSVEGMAGATVRISRESTSYQSALVDAGIISEDEVVKGRF